jgi:hypothetical protein
MDRFDLSPWYNIYGNGPPVTGPEGVIPMRLVHFSAIMVAFILPLVTGNSLRAHETSKKHRKAEQQTVKQHQKSEKELLKEHQKAEHRAIKQISPQERGAAERRLHEHQRMENKDLKAHQRSEKQLLKQHRKSERH